MLDKKYDIMILSGGFDPVHKGHVRMFKGAKAQANKVIVGANSDKWLVRKKIGEKSKIHQKGEKNSMYGKKQSEESKHKIRLIHLKKHNINLTKIDIENIKKHHKIISNVELAKTYSVPYQTIRNIHKGRYDWLCD